MQLLLNSCNHENLRNVIVSRYVAAKTLARTFHMAVVYVPPLLGAGPSVNQGLYDIQVVLRDCRFQE